MLSESGWAGIVLMSTCSLPSLSMLTLGVIKLPHTDTSRQQSKRTTRLRTETKMGAAASCSRLTNQRFEVGDRVRRKLNKGKLDKASAPSWSAEIFRDEGDRQAWAGKKNRSLAEKYKINAKGFGDKPFTRNDLQKVVGEVEKGPRA